ncbi:annexin A9 isoform X1 [Cervus elaphus]|uniref:annexin A9 isoform X1 n=1 Tax=Cervus elaphus TaxID=9860 RepID=UPI001CC2F503|nr:annexin A9 isoform X1 [Cervus elaphus]XP_043734016.1 annexin A9 isoform X1 [Cervus elaphus]
MSVTHGKMGLSLTQEILSHLGLANKTAAWGTLGTLRTFLSFSVDKDVQRLLKAIAGQGVDCIAILDVLTNRSREQRQLISRAFHERTQQDLLKSLQAALSGNLERIVVALLQPAAHLDARELRKALKGSGSAEDVALEILATRTPPQLRECLAVYKHSKGVEDGALRAGQDSPVSPALPAGSPVGACLPLVPLGSLLLPHRRAQSPQGDSQLSSLKREKQSLTVVVWGSRVDPEVMTRLSPVTVPRAPKSPSQPLADSAITPHPRLNGRSMQPGGKVGTCSRRCQFSAPGCCPCSDCHMPHPLIDFQVDAAEDIKSETRGILRDLLLALAKGGREAYTGIIDYNLAAQDVQALKQAEGPSTERMWVLVFTQRNSEHLVRVLNQYQRDTGRELEKTVRARFHGAACVALLSLALVIRNTPLYFADKLHQALQETEPNYQVLMRILISRSETDLLSIRAEFRKKYGKSLYSSLQDAVKGDCRSALLALCRAEDL